MTSPLTDLFRLALEATWQGSLIILLLLLIRPLLGARIPARYRYWLWALVFIRLLVPVSFLPPNPVSLQNVPVVDRPMEQVERVLPQARNMEVYALHLQGPSNAGTSIGTVTSPVAKPFPWFSVVASVWALGFLGALAFMAIAHLALGLRLKKKTTPIDPLVLETWQRCCQRLQIRKGPALRISADVTSPALVGLLRPVLLLPEKTPSGFSLEDWENVFVHELAHYRRGDHWINVLPLLAVALHWFNPLVWLGFRQLRIDRELATDEWALHHLQPERATAYGQTLLKILTQSSGFDFSVTSVGILEDRVQLKQRLQRIATFTPRKLAGSLLGLAIVIAGIVLILGRQTEKAELAKYAPLKPDEILVAAAQVGDLPAMRAMLRQGVPVDGAVDLDGHKNAMVAAAGANQIPAMELLLAKGADINLRAPHSPTPIESALMAGWIDSANFLLDHGAKCDPTTVIAAKGDRAAVQAVLDEKTLNVGRWMFMSRVAAANGQAETLRMLMEKIRTQPGNAQWELDDGPVLLAIARGHKDVVQVTMDESPYRDKLNKTGVMRLGWAAAQTSGMRDWLISKGFSIPDYTDGERLIDATEHENLPEMARLLKAGVDINYRGESSWTPVTKAAAWNKARSMKFLLDHGADPNSVHLPGWDYTAICLTSKPEIADMVLAAGGNINATLYKRNVHIIDYSIVFGQTDMVKWYIAHGVDPTKAQGDNPDRTLLFEAGSDEIAEILIQHGVDVNARSKDGTTALIWICGNGQKPAEVARVLLKHGADPNAADSRGQTPLMMAKDKATVDVLMEYGANLQAKAKDGQSMIQSAGGIMDATRLESLISHGAPFDPKKDGPTMMMRAAWRNQVDVIAFLLKQGVDPNLKGLWNKEVNMYMTPLTAAVTSGQYDAAKLLVDHGAKIQGSPENGKTGEDEMANALENRHAQIIKLFWEHGDRSISELTYAISQDQSITDIQKLIDAGVPVDQPKDKGPTPLELAARMGRLDVIEALVQHGAKVKQDSSQLSGAAFEGQDEVVAYLLQNGAKPDYQTVWNAVWNCNPYPEQRSKDHFEKTVKLLIDAGGLKGLSQTRNVDLLNAAIFTRYPAGNQTVVKMLLDGGLSLTAKNEKGKSILDFVHEACKEQTCSTPTKEMTAFLDQVSGKNGAPPSSGGAK